MHKPPPVSLLFGDGDLKVFPAAVLCEVPLVPGKGLQGFRASGTVLPRCRGERSLWQVFVGASGTPGRPLVSRDCPHGLSPGAAGGPLAVIVLAVNVHEFCCENIGAVGW